MPNAASAATAVRFDELAADTWVFSYFDHRLHFAQIAEVDLRYEHSNFDLGGELFKYKKIKSKKSFAVRLLPDAYRVLASSGRGNVHELPGSKALVDVLISSEDESDVNGRFQSMPLMEQIEAMGPKGWESLCFGYLIQEHGFLPTGLVIGGTLADFDIVGKNGKGEGIYAQCKKSPGRYVISADEVSAFSELADEKCFFFAFNGTDRNLAGVEIIEGDRMRNWLRNEAKGIAYANLLNLNPSR